MYPILNSARSNIRFLLFVYVHTVLTYAKVIYTCTTQYVEALGQYKHEFAYLVKVIMHFFTITVIFPIIQQIPDEHTQDITPISNFSKFILIYFVAMKKSSTAEYEYASLLYTKREFVTLKSGRKLIRKLK